MTLDGAEVPVALIGIAVPVDPGPHELRAAAGAAFSETRTVQVHDGTHESVSLQIEPSAVPPPTPAGAVPEARGPAPPSALDRPPSSAAHTTGLGAGYAGIRGAFQRDGMKVVEPVKGPP